MLYSDYYSDFAFVCVEEELRIPQIKLNRVAHTFKPSTHEAEAGRSLWVRGQASLRSKFPDHPGLQTCAKNEYPRSAVSHVLEPSFGTLVT